MGVKSQPAGDLRGILIPESRILGAAMTATSQAGPRSGGAVPSISTDMALDTSGTLDQALDEITMVCARAGDVGTASMRWKYTDDNAYRSWDPPTMLSGWEFIDRSTSAGKYAKPHVIRIASTGLLLACVTDATNTITAWAEDRYTKWSSATVEATGNQTTGCLVPLPSGRVLCFYTYLTDTAATQIRQAYSDDTGATWTVGSTACLDTPLAIASSVVVRIRAVYLRGQILLLLHYTAGGNDLVKQYASSDNGGTLRAIETVSSTLRAYPDITVYNGVAYVAMLRWTSSRTNNDFYPEVRAVTSASIPISSITAVDAYEDIAANDQEWGTGAATALTGGELAILADDEGALWLYGSDYDAAATREIGVRHSIDGGATWTSPYQSSRHPPGTVVFWSGIATDALADLAVCMERGRAVLLHTMLASSATHDPSLCALYLGGWTTVGKAEDDGYPRRDGVSGWEETWIPIEEPDNFGTTPWTKTTGGAPTATLGAGGLVLSAAAAENIYYTRTVTLTSPLPDGLEVEFRLVVGSGTWLHEVRISDGGNDFTIRVNATSTTLQLYDVNASANLGSAATTDVDDGVVVRVALDKPSGAWGANSGRVRAWYRVDGPYTGGSPSRGPRADREWTVLGGGAHTGLTFGVATTSRIIFGIVGAGAGSSASYKWLCYTQGLYTAGNIASSVTGSTRGHIVPSAASPMHLTEGLRVHGVRGPGMAGDTWTTSTDYEFPITNIDPSRKPSPTAVWRSTHDNIDQDITWTLDMGHRTGDPIAVYFAGCNWQTATLYRDAGVTKIMDIDLGAAGLAFTRTRDVLVPAAGGASALFPYSEGILKGCYADLGGGDVRKIKWNHAGVWRAAGTPASYPSARIILESYDAGDAASGTFTLRMSGGLFMVESLQSTALMQLTIDAIATAEDYLQIGVMVIGRLHLFEQYGQNRVLTFSPIASLSTGANGARTGRRLGNGRRAIEVAWEEGVDVSGIHTAGSSPDWVTLGYVGADALYAPAHTPLSLLGHLRECGGSVVPVVLCAAIPQLDTQTTTGAPYKDLNPAAAFYGRMTTEALRIETLFGNELEDPGEFVRVTGVRVEEEL